MKRMKPEAYKGEAKRITDTLIRGLLMRHGIWNADKITEEIERLFRRNRLEQSGHGTSKRRIRKSDRVRESGNVTQMPEASEIRARMPDMQDRAGDQW